MNCKTCDFQLSNTAQYCSNCGAKIVSSPADAWGADLVIKVKEPLPQEFTYFRAGLNLYTYLHLANEPRLTDELIKSKVRAIAYETIQLDDGSLPLLKKKNKIIIILRDVKIYENER